MPEDEEGSRSCMKRVNSAWGDGRILATAAFIEYGSKRRHLNLMAIDLP